MNTPNTDPANSPAKLQELLKHSGGSGRWVRLRGWPILAGVQIGRAHV